MPPSWKKSDRHTLLRKRILNGGSESQRDAFADFDAFAPRPRGVEERARSPSVRRYAKWLAISRPLSGPEGLYQVPIQLMAPDMAKKEGHKEQAENASVEERADDVSGLNEAFHKICEQCEADGDEA